MNVDDPIEARRELLGAADQLRQALCTLNCYGDALDARRLTHQRDGSAYGEVYDGFKLLVGVLFPQHTSEIIETMFDSDMEIAEAARHTERQVAERAEAEALAAWQDAQAARYHHPDED